MSKRQRDQALEKIKELKDAVKHQKKCLTQHLQRSGQLTVLYEKKIEELKEQRALWERLLETIEEETKS